MTPRADSGPVEHLGPAERVAAWATGIGVGLLAFMVTWLAGARITTGIWAQPRAAVIAMSIAVLVGIVCAVVIGRRLLCTVIAESHRT